MLKRPLCWIDDEPGRLRQLGLYAVRRFLWSEVALIRDDTKPRGDAYGVSAVFVVNAVRTDAGRLRMR